MMASMAGRYAAALFELAKDQRQLEQVERDLASFQAMLDGSEDLRRLVRSPVISAEDQAKALAAVLQKAGISGLTANFFMLIARNRRLFAARRHDEGLPRAGRPRARRGERRRRLRARAHARAAAAAVRHPAHLDRQERAASTRASIPGLLGGLVVKVGSRMIDSSLRTKLNNLKVVMKGIG